MKVIPAVNETEFGEVVKKIEQAAAFSDWVHLDVVDGRFAPRFTWNNSDDLAGLLAGRRLPDFNAEVHLMVENPEAAVEPWLKAGVKRIIAHASAVKDADSVVRVAAKYGAEAVLAFGPEETPPGCRFCEKFSFFQVLAVSPGFTGQEFGESAVAKIKEIKKMFPDSTVEVDGGINLETAKLAKEAGADILVSASYLWKAVSPADAFKTLEQI